MTMLLVVVYGIVAVAFIWWALRGARRLDVGHGHHAPGGHDAAPEPRAASADADDLTQIKGIGAVISAKLRTLDITTFEQIATLRAGDIESKSAKSRLRSEKNRPNRKKTAMIKRSDR